LDISFRFISLVAVKRTRTPIPEQRARDGRDQQGSFCTFSQK